jgi:type I restriction enzyme, R subunit
MSERAIGRLKKEAASNTKEQFAHSPDLNKELTNAIIGAYDAHSAMSAKALNDEKVRAGIMDILLNYSRLWESLRERKAS